MNHSYDEVNVYQKRYKATPWFLESSDENRALNEEYLRLEETAPGFIKREVKADLPDGLGYTVTTSWENHYAARVFFVANREFIARFLEKRRRYYARNNITCRTLHKQIGP